MKIPVLVCHPDGTQELIEKEVNLPDSSEQLAAEVRAQRDSLLAACDWTQMPDSPLSEKEKAAYQAYRQALRDVPQQEGFPETISWPEEPKTGSFVE